MWWRLSSVAVLNLVPVKTSAGEYYAAEAVVANLTAWYADGAGYGADSHVTQLTHALESAWQARAYGYSDERVIAGALLHDIGWKLSGVAQGNVDMAPPDESVARSLGILEAVDGETLFRAAHDRVGGAYLDGAGFPTVVGAMARGHVQAKRYLTGTDPAYFAKLSAGSKRTLEFQGGPMTAEEALRFREEPLFDLFLQLRTWDEGGKEPVLADKVPGWDVYLPLLRRVLEAKSEAPVRVLPSPKAPALRAPGLTQLTASWFEHGHVILPREAWLDDTLFKQLDPAVESLERATLRAEASTYERTADGAVVTSRTEHFVDRPDVDPFFRRLLVDGSFHQIPPNPAAHGLAGEHEDDDTAIEKNPQSPLVALVRALNLGKPMALYKEKVNYKHPGAGGYIPHQDYYVGLGVPQWSNESRGFVAVVCMIAVDESTVENGCAEIAPETWKTNPGWIGYGQDHNGTCIDVGDFVSGDRCHDHTAGPMWGRWDHMGPFVPVLAKPGDVLCYDNFMPHRSGNNTTPKSRRALFGVYYDPDQVDRRDLRAEYYSAELRPGGRRHQGSKKYQGKANLFHLGHGVLAGSQANAL